MTQIKTEVFHISLGVKESHEGSKLPEVFIGETTMRTANE